MVLNLDNLNSVCHALKGSIIWIFSVLSVKDGLNGINQKLLRELTLQDKFISSVANIVLVLGWVKII